MIVKWWLCFTSKQQRNVTMFFASMLQSLHNLHWVSVECINQCKNIKHAENAITYTILNFSKHLCLPLTIFFFLLIFHDELSILWRFVSRLKNQGDLLISFPFFPVVGSPSMRVKWQQRCATGLGIVMLKSAVPFRPSFMGLKVCLSQGLHVPWALDLGSNSV